VASVQIVFTAVIIRNAGVKLSASTLGIFCSVNYLGAVAGPYITGILWDMNIGFPVIFSIVAVICISAAIGTLVINFTGKTTDNSKI